MHNRKKEIFRKKNCRKPTEQTESQGKRNDGDTDLSENKTLNDCSKFFIY